MAGLHSLVASLEIQFSISILLTIILIHLYQLQFQLPVTSKLDWVHEYSASRHKGRGKILGCLW